MATVGWQIYEPIGGLYKASVDGMAAATSGLSTVISLKGYLLTNIIMPDTWTTAALSFLLSVDDGVTYNSFSDYGGEIAYTSSIAVASKALGMKPEYAMQLQGLLKIRSGLAALAVNQASSRTITLIAMKLEK